MTTDSRTPSASPTLPCAPLTGTMSQRDASGVEGLPLHLNFFWTAAGNVAYALSQWGMIVVLAKLTNAYMVGQFALGIAISAPALRLANLQLRSVQASDTSRQYHFRDYLGLRLTTTIIALLVVVLIALYTGDTKSTTWVICVVAFAKAVEAISDIYYGLFQAHGRLDYIGKSMILKAVFSIVALAAGLYFAPSVSSGVLTLGVAWLLLVLFFDARRSKPFLSYTANAPWYEPLRPRFNFSRQWTLTQLAFPLGVMMGLAALNLNMPRYFIQGRFGEEQLGVFSALAYMTVSVTTLADALGNSATPTLARLFANRELQQFRRFLRRMILYGLILGLFGLVVSALFGKQILNIAYGAQYAHYSTLFTWLMAAGAVGTVSSVLTIAITATRAFRYQVFIFAAVCVSNLVACWLLIPILGLTGAAIATLIASVVLAILSALTLLSLLSAAPQEEHAVVSKPLTAQLEFRS